VKIGDIGGLFKETYTDFVEDKAPRLGAALAYYTAFSLAPLLVIVIAIAAMVFGQEAAQGQIVGTIQGFVGENGARAIQEMIAGASKHGSGITATIIGVITLLFGASGVFGQLQDSLNTIWEVQPKAGRGIWGFIRDRFFSLTMVLGTGFLLLVSLVLTSAISMLGDFLGSRLPGGETLWQGINLVMSLAITTGIFALIYKYVPDLEIRWRDVIVGALVTGMLFTLGKFLIGLYLGKSTVASAYGAAGSLIVVLLWVYYSAQILFFGAEFTQVYANKYGSRVVPDANAEPVGETQRRQEGTPQRKGAATTTRQDNQTLPARTPAAQPRKTFESQGDE
jgi:membrane protein